MSSTRLLVLGVVRFAAPVHGYEVRRELLSWHLEDVSNVKPGSIYSALKTLERDRLISVVGSDTEPRGSRAPAEPGQKAKSSGRPERTVYELTGEGEKEFQVLLRKAWWTVEQPIQPLIAALTMFPSLPREELIAALESRIEALRARERQGEYMYGGIQDGDSAVDGRIPEHVREILLFLRGQARAEMEWTLGLRQRLKNGAYRLAGEPPDPGP